MNDPFDRSFRDRTLAGETLFGLFLDLASPASAELCAAAGYDWLLVDLEHGAATEDDLLGLLQAIEPGGLGRPGPAPVRGADPDRTGARPRRPRDHGSAARFSADQAREAVTFLRYPPQGIRGVATRVRGAGLGVVGHADVQRLNERVVGIIQIESVGGLHDADEIAAIDGVDVLFVGPADLSHSLGIPGQFQHADYLAPSSGSSPPAAPTARPPGSSSTTPPSSRAILELGFTFVGIGADGAFVADTAKRFWPTFAADAGSLSAPAGPPHPAVTRARRHRLVARRSGRPAPRR